MSRALVHPSDFWHRMVMLMESDGWDQIPEHGSQNWQPKVLAYVEWLRSQIVEHAVGVITDDAGKARDRTF